MFKLGRGPRAFNKNIPHRDSPVLLPGAILQPAPIERDWTVGLPDDLGIMGNDTLGDCADAGYYHGKQVWTQNASGLMVTESTDRVVQLYSETTGWKPADGGEGPGSVLQDVLTYLLNTGAPVGDGTQRHKLLGFFEVDPAKQMDIQYEIDACGWVYLGFNVPAFLMDGPVPDVWDVQASNTDIIGGHCVGAAAYNYQGVTIISWGKKYKMTWEFWAKYVDEAYPLLDSDWITKMGTSPAGRTIAELQEAMQALKAA
jgi:hypothetical protein